MPATWTLMTRPMIRSVVPSSPLAWPMCTGVMTMTPTITEWETTTDVSPSRPDGLRHTAPSAASVARRGRTAGAPDPPPRRRESSSGSGRISTRKPTATTAKAAREITNPPLRGGMSSHRPRSAPGPARLGPRTDPMVVAQTTRLRERPRRSGSARSAAA